MNYGLYLAAAGTLAHMTRQDILTNNLVNAETIGFKPDTVAMRQRLPARLETGALVDPQLMLEQLGGAPRVDANRVSLEQGPLIATDRDLDLAIEGDGFFAVRDGDQLRLTRDGRFAVNEAGELVTADNGFKVLDRRNRPILLDRRQPVRIGTDGGVMQDGRRRATLRLASPANPALLHKLGDGLLTHPDAAAAPQSSGARVVQRHLEGNPVDPIRTLNDIIGASKAVGSTLTMVRYHSTILDQAINTFGRVA